MWKIFNIEEKYENDGIEVQKEQIEKWTYIKYPPHSKYLLWQNLKKMILFQICIIIAIIAMFTFDSDINYTYYVCVGYLEFLCVPSMHTIYTEWKNGRYWNT